MAPDRLLRAIFKTRIRRMRRTGRLGGFDGFSRFNGFSGFGGFRGLGGFSGFDGYHMLFLKGFSVSFTLLLKVLYLLVSYPLSYTWLKRERQISIRKERFIRRYLQYGVLGDCVFWFLVLMYIIIYKKINTKVAKASESNNA